MTHLCGASRDDETRAGSTAAPGMPSRSPPARTLAPHTAPQLSIVHHPPWSTSYPHTLLHLTLPLQHHLSHQSVQCTQNYYNPQVNQRFRKTSTMFICLHYAHLNRNRRDYASVQIIRVERTSVINHRSRAASLLSHIEL